MAGTRGKASAEPEYVLNVPPASQVDLEQRMADDYVSPHAVASTVGPQLAYEESEEGYIGTDPIYQNYANETEKPLAAGEGVEADAEKKYEESVLAAPEDDSKTSDSKSSTTPTKPATPAEPVKPASTSTSE